STTHVVRERHRIASRGISGAAYHGSTYGDARRYTVSAAATTGSGPWSRSRPAATSIATTATTMSARTASWVTQPETRAAAQSSTSNAAPIQRSPTYQSECWLKSPAAWCDGFSAAKPPAAGKPTTKRETGPSDAHNAFR